MPATVTIKQKILLPATPSQVYEVFTNPKLHSLVTGARATGGGKVAEKFTAWDGYITGKVLLLKKNKLIKQEWKTDGWEQGFGPSVLELRFEAKKEGTQVTLIHSKLLSSSAPEYEQGWHDYYWKPLETYFIEHAAYEQEQEKEKAMVLADKKKVVLSVSGLEVFILKNDGSMARLCKSNEAKLLWRDVIKALRKR